MQNIEQQCTKQIKQSITFAHNGEDFSAIHQAEKFCRKVGLSYGPMERDAPIGVFYGESYISKWRNLGPDRKHLDGALVSENFREKDVTLHLFLSVPNFSELLNNK